MNPSTKLVCIERHLAVDLHKHYLVIGGVNPQQAVVLPPRRLDWSAWPTWAKANLRSSDEVVVEATTNAWEFYDQVSPQVGRVLVANAGQVALIAKTRVKTDNTDVMKLARLSAAGLIPEVWVPPVAVRELRALLAHRRQVIKNRTMVQNRLHSVLHRHQLQPPAGDPFAAKQGGWWDSLPVSPTERLQLRHDLATLGHLGPQVEDIDAELNRLSTSAPWAESVLYLMQLPGVGLLTGMTLLAAIGDITRFDSAKKLVGYAGLGAGVHDSGLTHRGGHITKQGRREMRWVLVEAMWVAVDKNAHWAAEFARLTRRMNKNTAIVALARKLLVVVWHVLTEHAADRQADPDQVAFKLMAWSWKLTAEQRGGLTSRQFVRYQLMRLHLGEGLTHLVRGGAKRLIAPAEEVLKLKPELQSVA